MFYKKGNKYTFNSKKEKSYQGAGYSTGNKKVPLYGDEYVSTLGPHTLVYPKDWWEISMLATSDKTRTGSPTQKPPLLYKKIIEASSHKGDIVVDPFCGCATTLVAAERLGRQWIGMDIRDEAHDIVYQKMQDETYWV